MKRFTLLCIATFLLNTSCKKDKEYCWVCSKISTGDELPEQCGKTENDIKNIENQNGWTCVHKR